MAETTSPQGDARPRPRSRNRPAGSGAETGWAVTGTMMSGMAVWGGAGWLLDHWWDTQVFFPVGVILGMALAIYLVVARFGGGGGANSEPMSVTISSSSYSTYRRTPGGRRSRPRATSVTQKGQR